MTILSTQEISQHFEVYSNVCLLLLAQQQLPADISVTIGRSHTPWNN